MNGSENSYASALFFSLMSLGALLKLDDTTGWIVGTLFALIAAISLRRGLIKAAQDTEENHQRMEIQFQQLRNKVAETFSSNVNAMNSVNDAMDSINDAAHHVRENLQSIGGHAGESENLSRLVASAEDIRLTVAALDENSSALNAELEKIFVAMQEQKNSSVVAEELKKISALEETNKTSLQTVMKLLQLVGQVLKHPSYAKDLEKISASIDRLVKITSTAGRNKEPILSEQDLGVLKKIVEKISVE